MPSDRAEGRPYDGFHSYADDTPRAAEPIDAPEAPLMAGFAEAPPWRRFDDEEDAPRMAWPKIAAVGGAAMGIAAAVALGWSAVDRPDAAPAAGPPAPAAETAPPLQVVVTDPPPPPPLPRTSERLEVLPKTEATTPAPVPLAPVPLARAVIPVSPEPGVAVVAERTPEPLPAPNVAVAAQDATAAPAPAAPRFNDCRDAPTRAYAMVCRDMGLAEADRRMKRAYRAALAAGVPEDELARDQDDWLAVREDAAEVSPRAVADIYRQRTRELRAMAEDARE